MMLELVASLITSAIPINNANDLWLMHENLNEDFILMNDITNLGEFPPIGTFDNPFTGTFDGNGHFIDGQIWHTTGPYNNPVGLFGEVVNADIHNLTVLNPDIIGCHHTGAIIGRVHHSTISNLTVIGGKVWVNDSTIACHYTGGVVGHIHPHTYAEFLRAEGVDVIGSFYVGAITGNVHGSVLTRSTHEDCTVHAMHSYAGGVTGLMQIDPNVPTPEIRLSGGNSAISANQRAGGIVGGTNMNGAIIRKCWSEGTVECFANNVLQGYCGGAFGYLDGAVNDDPIIYTIIRDVWTSSDVVSHGIYAGGFAAAIFSGDISHCRATGNVICTEDAAGGFSALTYQYINSLPNIIKDSYATSNVTVKTKLAAGFSSSTAVTTFTNCYAIGELTATEPNGSTPNTLLPFSGMIGGHKIKFPPSAGVYYLDGNAPINQGLGNPLSYKEFANPNSFENWDFKNTWTMAENGFPILQEYCPSDLNADGQINLTDLIEAIAVGHVEKIINVILNWQTTCN